MKLTNKELSERAVFWSCIIIGVIVLLIACFGCSNKFALGDKKYYHKSYDNNRGNRVY